MYFVPSFLYANNPACKKASQICATLLLSLAATASKFLFTSERIRSVSLVSFAVIESGFYHPPPYFPIDNKWDYVSSYG